MADSLFIRAQPVAGEPDASARSATARTSPATCGHTSAGRSCPTPGRMTSRDELLDLMTDAVGAEYSLSAPSGDWLTDLVSVGEQARAILRRHPWLAPLVITRPVLGPNGLTLLGHVLDVLAPHPADIAAKLEAFAMLNTITAVFVQNELAGGSSAQRRNAAYLQHAVTSGGHPGLARRLARAETTADPEDRYADFLTRVLTGLLGPPPRA